MVLWYSIPKGTTKTIGDKRSPANGCFGVCHIATWYGFATLPYCWDIALKHFPGTILVFIATKRCVFF